MIYILNVNIFNLIAIINMIMLIKMMFTSVAI